MPFARSEVHTALLMRTQTSRYNIMQRDAYLSAFRSSLLHTFSGLNKCVTGNPHTAIFRLADWLIECTAIIWPFASSHRTAQYAHPPLCQLL
jgi:hypothetical protein